MQGMALCSIMRSSKPSGNLENPDFYLPAEGSHGREALVGAADDIILRKRGVEFVDGTAPGLPR